MVSEWVDCHAPSVLAMTKTNYPSWRAHEVSVAIQLDCHAPAVLAMTINILRARNDD